MYTAAFRYLAQMLSSLKVILHPAEMIYAAL